MSKTITIPGIIRFFGALTYKERIHIQRRMDVSIAEVMGNPLHPLADELAIEMIYAAARRLNRDDITLDSLQEMDVPELDLVMRELFAALGFDDQEIEVDENGVPLVMGSQTKSESSEDTSETENSSTSTTGASVSDGA
jgi:hypothetical protein